MPSAPTTKVDRITPTVFLPYSVFSPYAPYASRTERDGSASSGNVSCCASRNFASFSGLSGEMPTTSIPAPSSEARLSRKSQASLVQPGVMAAG